MKPDRDAYRRILAEHEGHELLYARFRYFHPLRRLERRTRRRAWIGTRWPWAARMIGRWWGFRCWLWQVTHPRVMAADLEAQERWERENPEIIEEMERAVREAEP